MLRTAIVLLAALGAVASGCLSPAARVAPAAAAPVAAPGANATALVHRLSAAGIATAVNLPAAPVEPALLPIGHDAGEPTLGLTKSGALVYAAITFKNTIPVLPVTDILSSTDGAATWKDITPKLPGGALRTHFESGDPFVYVDPATSRVFDIDQRVLVTCHTVITSDDLGASWGPTDSPSCVSSAQSDHQSIVAAKPHELPTMGYPDVVLVCWNSVTGPACSRSLDGARTFVPAAPPFLQADGKPQCGLVGHLKSAPDGTVYLPRDCDGVVSVARTSDDAQSWTVAKVATYTVPSTGDPQYDPSVAVDKAGNVYVAWEDPDGRLLLSHSTDKGTTWSRALSVLPPTLTVGHLPALAAGDAGRLALVYMGTDAPQGYKTSKDDEPKEVWNGYLAVIVDALSDAPVATTVRVNPADDPLAHGACGPSYRCVGSDFFDVTVDADGRPWASFVDGCSKTCAAKQGEKDDVSLGLVGTLAQGPSLFANVTALPPIHGVT